MKSLYTIEERHQRRLEKQRLRRTRNHNSETRKYEKTPKGFLMRLYRNMQSRVSGVQKGKFHLYKGKILLPRQEFYDWSLNNPSFLSMFKTWEESKYDRKLTPTVDRINPELGYEISNMRWLTHSENSHYGSLRQHQLYPNLSRITLWKRWHPNEPLPLEYLASNEPKV